MNINFISPKDLLNNRGYFLQKKITDKIILCNPKFDFKKLLNYDKKLIFVEKLENVDSVDNYIPCLFIKNSQSSSYLIYFHGNSEDIFESENICSGLKTNLNMNIIIVEYPGYSIYLSKKRTPKQLYDDSFIVYNWFKKKIKNFENNVFICGRSLGTSIAIYLSSIIQPKALFLISAFTSIKDIGSDKFCSWFVEDIFISINYIGNIKSPILLIHGKNDGLISYSHSEKLEKKAKENNYKVRLEIKDKMTHNDFDINKDIIMPIQKFIENYEIFTNDKANENITEINKLIKIPKSVSSWIESEVFNIKDFEVYKTKEIKNAFYLIQLVDQRIALTYDSIIGIYDDRNLNLDYEIDLYKNIEKSKGPILIYYLFQMKNEVLVCSTNLGDIFLFKIDLDEYETIDYFTMKDNEEIYKIDYFSSDLLCLLSDKYINIFPEQNFKQNIFSCKNKDNYYDFVKVPDQNLYAFLSEKGLYLYEFKGNKLTNCIEKKEFKALKLNHIMTVTNKLILIGGIEGIFVYNHNQNLLNLIEITDIKGDAIIYIHKIHDELLLAGTEYGKVVQIKISPNCEIISIAKFISENKITSVLYKNMKFIFVANKEFLKLLKSVDENRDDKCCCF